MSIQPPSATLAQWFATPLGQYVLEREFSYFDPCVADIFGYNAFQLGLTQFDFLRTSRIAFKCRIGGEAAVDLRADFRDLPLATNSADLILLPHVLDFNAYPHQILRDVARVLMPEGQVVISGFNPWSLWGMRRVFGTHKPFPWCGQFINLPRLKDWLALLGLEIVAGRMNCYAPPCAQDKWLRRCGFMESAGDRWWPIAGGVYYLQAVKRVRGLRLIMPKWSDQLVPKKRFAASPNKVTQGNDALAARDNGYPG